MERALQREVTAHDKLRAELHAAEQRVTDLMQTERQHERFKEHAEQEKGLLQAKVGHARYTG